MLTLWRARLRNSETPERIFDAVRKVVDQTGILRGRRRRVLDSTILDDAVVTQDTVTMICAQIRKVRRLIPRARQAVLSRDYEQAGKPSCDWSDPQSRSSLIDGLVKDGQAVLDAVENTVLDAGQSEAVGLLGVVVGQDVEPDPDREGRWRIARRVARDRTISVVDPDARHGRKTSSQRRDGYKAHIAAEPETEIITVVEVTAANTPDGETGARMLQKDATAGQGEPAGTNDPAGVDDPAGVEVIADSAYGSGEVRAKLKKAGYTTTVKPIPLRRNYRLGSGPVHPGRFRGGSRPKTDHLPGRGNGEHQPQRLGTVRKTLHRLWFAESLHHQPTGDARCGSTPMTGYWSKPAENGKIPRPNTGTTSTGRRSSG